MIEEWMDTVKLEISIPTTDESRIQQTIDEMSALLEKGRIEVLEVKTETQDESTELAFSLKAQGLGLLLSKAMGGIFEKAARKTSQSCRCDLSTGLGHTEWCKARDLDRYCLRRRRKTGSIGWIILMGRTTLGKLSINPFQLMKSNQTWHRSK